LPDNSDKIKHTTPNPVANANWAQEILWGWDSTPGVVGVWAERNGRVTLWRRIPQSGDTGALVREQTRFHPWALLPSLDGLRAAGIRHEPQPDSQSQFSHVGPETIWVQELTGRGRLRYLVSAPHADILERALRQALTVTLARPIQRLGDVGPDDLLLLPLEEQYLMRSGVVYFRGLRWQDVHRLTFDLETEGLDANRHRVFLIAVRDNRGLSCTLDVAEHAAHGSNEEAAEADLIRRFVALVRAHDPDVLENHNIAGFDLPFLMTRAAHLGVPLSLQRAGLPPPFFRRAAPRRAWGAWGQNDASDDSTGQRRVGRLMAPGREIIDTLDAVWRYDFSMRSLPGHGLKAVARAFDVARTDREYIEGAQVGAMWRVDPDRVRRYAGDDVEEAAAISALLGGPAFALAQMAPRRYERVAETGPATGLLDPLIVRAYLHAGAALPAYRPASMRERVQAPDDDEDDTDEDVESHSGGATYLFAAGVARHVVKCDIASLYPSLIRQHRISPQRDTLGVFLTLVDQ
ncbi:MAG TPA: 3'-5' exonuclease, partial [Ktedonobacterales bacterium]|nr:3'-5' exonuclease [Ktedonobacterales bacterium]